MQRDGLTPDLGRLEQLSQVDQMNPAEYREAWAWVHLMLRGDPKLRPILLSYIQQLRKTATPGPMQPQLKVLTPDLNAALLAHLSQI